jgi:aspartate-semialdehyde dehydrogenase
MRGLMLAFLAMNKGARDISTSRTPTICLMSAGGSVSKEWSPKIGQAGLHRHR